MTTSDPHDWLSCPICGSPQVMFLSGDMGCIIGEHNHHIRAERNQEKWDYVRAQMVQLQKEAKERDGR